MNEIYLTKESSTGKALFWRAINKGNTNTYTHGQVGGKEPIPQVEKYDKGKNIGKKNETTAEEQALFDMETTALKKIDSGYKLIKGEISEHKSHVKVSGDFKQPMKAHKWKEQGHKLPEVMYAQPKLDGIRCNGELDGSLKTIKGKPTIGTPHVNEAIRKIAPILKANGILRLDGELYSHDLTFEEIISVTKQTKTLSNNYQKVSLFVFDLITEEPMNTADRIRLLDRIGKHFEDALIQVETATISKHEVEAFHTKYVSQGYEGIMLRDPKGKYEHKRSYLLQKYKHFIDDEYELVDFEKEEHKDTLGALWFIDKKKDRFKAGLKMSHARRLEIWKNKKAYLGKLCTVRYQELTDKEKVPRFGTTVAIRDYE